MQLRINVFLLMSLVLLTLIPVSLEAAVKWKTLVTDSFIVYYKEGWELEAYNALQTLEFHRPYVEKLTGNKRKRFPIIIEDMGNYVNGFANPVGERINLFAYFPTGSVLEYVEDWWTLVGVHEYIHILQMTNEGGVPKAFRKVFGNLMYTNMLLPMWMIEGITVYGESDIHPYSGRMNGGNYPAIVATLAQTDNLPSATKASYITYDNPAGNYYVYGGAFYRYLANRYGEELFAELYRLNGRRSAAWLTPFFPNAGVGKSFKSVYGNSLPRLWKDWQEYEKSKEFFLPETYLTDDGWNKSELKLIDNELYYISFSITKTGAGSSFSNHSIKALNLQTEETRIIHQQATPYATGYQIVSNGDDSETEISKSLFYTRNEIKSGFANTSGLKQGTVPELYMLNLDTNVRIKLYQGSFRAFHVLADGDIILSKDLRNHQGSELYLLKANNGYKEAPILLMQTDYLIHRILTNDNRIFVNARRFWRNTSIFELDMNTKELHPVIDNPVSESAVGFLNGEIVYNANYDDYLGSYMIDINSKEVKRLTGSSYMTNANIGNKGMVYFISLSNNGYDIAAAQINTDSYTVAEFTENNPPFARITELPEIVSHRTRAVSLNLPESVSSSEIIVKEGGYWRNLVHLIAPRQFRIPYYIYGEDEHLIGYSVIGNDAVGHFPYWSATLQYDIDKENFDYMVELRNHLLLPLRHNIYYSTLNNKTLSSDQYVELLTRQNWGIKRLGTGFYLNGWDNFERKSVTPYVDIDLHQSWWKLRNRFSFITETKRLFPSDRERKGYQISNYWRNKLPLAAELNINLFAAYDPDAEKDEVFPAIRGYRDGLAANEGFALQTSVSKVLFQVREGFWNPQVYLEDVGISLFFDTAIPREGQGSRMQYSYGLELHFETHFGFLLPAFIGYRISLNRDNKLRHYITFFTDISW